MNNLRVAFLGLAALLLNACATDDMEPSANSSAPVAGETVEGGVEPSARGMSPGVAW